MFAGTMGVKMNLQQFQRKLAKSGQRITLVHLMGNFTACVCFSNGEDYVVEISGSPKFDGAKYCKDEAKRVVLRQIARTQKVEIEQ
jgi:hypothetical protein